MPTPAPVNQSQALGDEINTYLVALILKIALGSYGGPFAGVQ
jgi:hypothetical protein